MLSPNPAGIGKVRCLPDMPSPGAPAPPRLPIEDSYLELLADTLDSLDSPARGQFLQRFFRTITHLDLREGQCVQLWDEMLLRRREMSESLARPVALKTALMDVLSSAGVFRVPVIIEYQELKQLQLNAVTDPLTGLHNRRDFSETFDKELNRAKRYGQPIGLVILDLHRFKEVNDKYGHPRGDDVLRAAATTLKKALRTSDSAFRIGGDEFALLLPQTDSVQALALSRRIGVVFAETLLSLQLTVGVSMDHGVATYPQDGEHADQLIRVADERLYRLKHANHGKTANGTRVETPPPQATYTETTVPPRPASTPLTTPSSSAAPPVETQTQSTPSPERIRETPQQTAPVQPSQPISINTGRVVEKTESSLAAAVNAAASEPPARTQPAAPSVQETRMYSVQRKAERVSMLGTNAYAILGEHGTRRARVIDLGFGGVALEMDTKEEPSDNLLAVLHVPILPPVRVSLKAVWSRRTSEGSYRVGCCFVS